MIKHVYRGIPFAVLAAAALMLPKHHEDLAKQGRQLPLLAASPAWKTSGSGDPRLAVLIGEARLVLSNGQMH